MNNPKLIAVISGIAFLFLSYSIFGPVEEAPSSTLNAMNWLFFLLAAFACIGSVVQIVRSGKL